jgi:glycosyltransferase involved in cell wall biosynthesis
MKTFPGHLGLQQRILPSYRVPFFDLLASACARGLSVFAGEARSNESVNPGVPIIAEYTRAHNLHIFSGPAYLLYQRGLLDWLKGWGPEALIVEANPRYLSTPPAVRWMHARKRPVLGWGLGAPPIAGSQAAMLNARRLAFLNHFDGLIAYSQRGAAEYAALGFPENRIFVAHNSVSPAPSTPPARQPALVDRPSILFVGRLQARKRVDLLLRACAQLESKPRLVIVGEGPERAALEKLASSLYPAAQFIGELHGERLRPYFSAADLFVLPGTGGLAVQEAMSHGLPVIVAQGDGTQDDLVRPGSGWQVPPGNFEALLAALKEALRDIPRLRRMGAESFRIVAEEINLEKMVDSFVEALTATTYQGRSPDTP